MDGMDILVAWNGSRFTKVCPSGVCFPVREQAKMFDGPQIPGWILNCGKTLFYSHIYDDVVEGSIELFIIFLFEKDLSES